MHVTDLIYVFKKSSVLGVIVLTCFSMINFSNNLKLLAHETKQLTLLEQQMQSIQTLVDSDKERQTSLTKITKIIYYYNPALAENTKYLIANEIYDMSLKYDNLDIDLICATITHETALTWQPDIKSPAGAMGLMQIMPATGRYLSRLEGIPWTNAQEILYNPVFSIKMGCRYLSSLIELYHIDGGLAAYNGGASRAAKWIASGRNNQVLFEETRGYVPAILDLYDIYKN